MVQNRFIILIAALMFSLSGSSQIIVAKKLFVNGNLLTDAVTGDTIATVEWVNDTLANYFKYGDDTIRVDSINLNGTWYSSVASGNIVSSVSQNLTDFTDNGVWVTKGDSVYYTDSLLWQNGGLGITGKIDISNDLSVGGHVALGNDINDTVGVAGDIRVEGSIYTESIQTATAQVTDELDMDGSSIYNILELEVEDIIPANGVDIGLLASVVEISDDLSVGGNITANNLITGTGTNTYIPYWTGTNTLGASNRFFWSSATSTLRNEGASGDSPSFELRNSGGNFGGVEMSSTGGTGSYVSVFATTEILKLGGSATGTGWMELESGVGEMNGTFLVTGNTTLGNAITDLTTVNGKLTSDSIGSTTTGRTALTDYVLYPPHASMNFSDSSVLLTMSADTYQQVTNTGDSLFRVRFESNGLTVNADTVVLLNEAAHYEYEATVGFSTANGDVVRLALYDENGIVQSFGVATTNAASEETISLSGIHYDDGTDGKLWLEIKTVGGENITLIDGSFNVKFYHKIY